MTRPLLLGEAPAAGGDPARPLSGRTAGALCSLLAIEPRTKDAYALVRERFDCLNVIGLWEDAYPWNSARARQRWCDWRADHPGPRVVVCLGRHAVDAVDGEHGTHWFDWRTHGDLTYAVIPHPSGLNRLYNDPVTRMQAGTVLREAVERA